MVRVRRLLSAVLAIALAQFGVMATAPAHAHEDGAGHGVREVVLAHGHGHGHGHADSGHGTHEHGTPASHHDDDHHDRADSDGTPAQEQGAAHGEHAAHVHGCPQFAPVDANAASLVLTAYAELTWPRLGAPAVSYSSYPPLRPPRASL